jgi:hypothetical protein
MFQGFWNDSSLKYVLHNKSLTAASTSNNPLQKWNCQFAHTVLVNKRFSKTPFFWVGDWSWVENCFWAGIRFRFRWSMGFISVVSVELIEIIMNLTYTQTCLLSPVCYYIAFRSPNPDEETLNDVKEALKENELDLNEFVKWENSHCWSNYNEHKGNLYSQTGPCITCSNKYIIKILQYE